MRCLLSVFLFWQLFFTASCNYSAHQTGEADVSNIEPVIAMSVAGSSSLQLIEDILLNTLEGRYVRSAYNSKGEKVRLKGHRPFNKRYIDPVETSNVKVVLGIRDPRDIVIHIVKRSLSTDLRKKWFKPNVNSELLSLYRLINTDSIRDNPAKVDFLEHYINKAGTKELIDSIFVVAHWVRHPQVYALHLEELLGTGKNSLKARTEALNGLSEFLNIDLSKKSLKKIEAICAKHLKKFDKKRKADNSWPDIYSEGDKEIFKEYWGDLLIELGYESDYNW